MTKTPKRLTRKTRKHLPALNPLELKGFEAMLQALPHVSKEGKAAVLASVRTAANPSAENPLVVISTMDVEERMNIESASPGYMQLFSGIGARGRMNLMLDTEIDALIQQESEE